MLKVTGVELRLSREDLLAMVDEHLADRVAEFDLGLGDGEITLRMHLPTEALPAQVRVPVECRIRVRRFEAMSVELELTWSNLPDLPGPQRERLVQQALAALPVRTEGERLLLSLAEVLPLAALSFRLEGVRIEPGGVTVRLSDLILLTVGLTEAPASALVPAPAPERPEVSLGEHQSYYERMRAKVSQFATERAPKWAKPLVPWVLAAPDFFVLLVRLARDERVPVSAKLLAGVAVAYFLSPLDLVPDMIPLMGQLDDVALGLFAIDQISERVDGTIVEEHWPGDGSVLELVRSGSAIFTKALPAKLLAALRRRLRRP